MSEHRQDSFDWQKVARRDLARWAKVNAERDQLVRAAAASGLPKAEIHAITGIARTTIDRILGAGQ